jgi:CRP/FNR family cyclic AMP-dependent transcriptional regulator
MMRAMLERLPGWLGWARDTEHARRVGILGRTPIFAGLPRRLLARLAVQLFEKAYAPGEAVFLEGDPGKGLFVVLDGEIEVVRETAQGSQRIETFGPGTAFGELALIDDLPRSATALATTPTRLLILYRSHFEDLVAGDRVIALVVAKNLLRLLAGYVRAANVTRAKAEAAVAPAPAGDGSARPTSR